MAYPTKTKYAQISNDDHEVVILPKENIWKHWALILCFLVGVFFGAAVAAASGAAAATKHENAKGQHIALLPEMEMNVTVEFVPDYSYWNMSSYESEQLWAPIGRHGGIFIHDPQRFGLSPGIETTGDYDMYPLSVFHQLHCLSALRERFASVMNDFPLDPSTYNHTDHCFDYLRQNIMCASDLTLEKARVDPDGHRRATDGWGTVHQCKDWVKVVDMRLENRFKYAFSD